MDTLLKIFEQIKNSQFVRILLVSFLILVLQIPTVMMQGLVSDRQTLRQEAIRGITTKWGAQQKVVGPQLVVPYIKRLQSSGNTPRSEVKLGIFLPQVLDIAGAMDTETRYRGIFEVPVYKTALTPGLFHSKQSRPKASKVVEQFLLGISHHHYFSDRRSILETYPIPVVKQVVVMIMPCV